MKARKKPVVIEYFQWRNNQGAFECWMDELPPEVNRDSAVIESNGLFILTLEGRMHVSYRDYVICGTQNELYPCKPDVFDDIYELVDE